MNNKIGLLLVVLALLISGCKKDPLYTDAGTFTDSRDNHVYKSLKIGGQTWMAENLAYLPSVSPSSEGSDSSKFYYVYDYQGISISEAKAAAHYSTYGVLYNWAAATNACPAGWHLPGDEEWWTLTDNLDSQGVTAGGKMKETGTAHWLSPNTGATNESGFTAIPGGERTYSGSFKDIGDFAWFWSSSQLDSSLVWIRVLLSTNGILHPDAYDRSDGFSVRCLKN